MGKAIEQARLTVNHTATGVMGRWVVWQKIAHSQKIPQPIEAVLALNQKNKGIAEYI